MKVVHVMTSTSGGAGVAAMRIHEALRASGVDSNVVCQYKPAQADESVTQFPTRFPSILERIALKAGVHLSVADKTQHRRDGLGLDGVPYSEPISDYDILDHPLVRSADIIHLHWVGGFLDWKSFFKNVGRPVVWTLHDLNPILGGFHYRFGKSRSGAASKNLDESFALQKERMLSAFTPMHVVGPSSWIETESRWSKILGHFPHSVIPYPMDPTVWRRFDRDVARSVFGIRTDAPLLLTAAEQAGEPRKGGDMLEQVLADPAMKGRFAWAAAGTPSQALHAIPLGFLSDPRLLALAYSAADFLVLPSREDNFPNVILESLMVGTPVVSLPVGGIPEMVENGVNGVLGETADAKGLLGALIRASELSFDPERIRANAMAAYDPANVAAAYRRVYESFS